MSYSVTVYFNDADIYSTKIYGVNGNVNLTRYYGNAAYSATGFYDTTTFTATPADGCEFTKWMYRIGDEIYDESIDARESTDNPFRYSGTENIVIRAEGQPIGSGGDEPEVPTSKVAKWSWYVGNYYATDTETINSYQALLTKDYTTEFSYLVWNDLVDKVSQIHDVKGYSWDKDAYGLPMLKTMMSERDTELTAARFNSLRYNIGIHYSTGINEVSPGDDVLAEYFFTLVRCINGWIDTL